MAQFVGDVYAARQATELKYKKNPLMTGKNGRQADLLLKDVFISALHKRYFEIKVAEW